MMEVRSFSELASTVGTSIPALVTALLNEFSAVTDYRTLRDTLPRRLAALLRCRCVIIYLRVNETLHFASGSFDDTPGWSGALLRVAHINPIAVDSTVAEALAWRSHHAVFSARGSYGPSLVALPLRYRNRTTGVISVYRSSDIPLSQTAKPAQSMTSETDVSAWSEDDGPTLEVIAHIVALLLENTRLLERDRERIQELSSLNNLVMQLNRSLYDFDAVQRIVIQRVREITQADFCGLLQPETLPEQMSWVTPALHRLLFAHFYGQKRRQVAPILSERVGDGAVDLYLRELPAQVKTFFAIPMFFSGTSLYTERNDHDGTTVSGIIAGASYVARKMRREELDSLHILASQVGTALEHMQLMRDVIEARNHARKLLQQVVEDQRQKELMEEENRRLDRLAALGEMSASVAHEVRNPLASIKASMQMLKHELACEATDTHMLEEAQESVAVVLKEVERLDAIVHDLLLFARPRQLHAAPCDLTELCDHVLHVLGGQCAEAKVAVQRMYHPVPQVWIDEGQMEQVILNLCMNAVQAMPDGGTLTVACRVVTACAPARKEREGDKTLLSDILRRVAAKEQEWLEVAVSDTGMGIPGEQLERLFQPFFTTKAHGIGLGLSITRRLVEDHRGHILVESVPGRGATFSVRLPIDGDGKRIEDRS